MKTKETTIKILFSAIVCALISATIFSMKPPRAVSYAETGNCPHEYDDDCDDECNLCGEKRTPMHYFGEWTPSPNRKKKKSFQNRISQGLS